MLDIGKASGHRVNLLMQSEEEQPCDVGRGPSRLMCTWSNLAFGELKVPSSIMMWQKTLILWHWRQE